MKLNEKLNLPVAVALVVVAVIMAVISIKLSGPQVTERTDQPGDELDFEERIAAMQTAPPSSSPAAPGAPAPAPPPAGGRPLGTGSFGAGASASAPVGGRATLTSVRGASATTATQPVTASQPGAVVPAVGTVPAADAPTNSTPSNDQQQAGDTAQFIAKSDNAALSIESQRLKNATTKADLQRRIDINRELVNRHWAVRRAAEERSKATTDRLEYDKAQAEVQSMKQQINDLELAITADTTRLNSM